MALAEGMSKSAQTGALDAEILTRPLPADSRVAHVAARRAVHRVRIDVHLTPVRGLGVAVGKTVVARRELAAVLAADADGVRQPAMKRAVHVVPRSRP